MAAPDGMGAALMASSVQYCDRANKNCHKTLFLDLSHVLFTLYLSLSSSVIEIARNANESNNILSCITAHHASLRRGIFRFCGFVDHHLLIVYFGIAKHLLKIVMKL